MPNLDQLMSFVRYVLTLASGWAIGKGYLDESTATMIGGIVIAAAPMVWAYLTHTKQATINAAAAIPEVTKVVVDSEKRANAAPSEKVVSE